MNIDKKVDELIWDKPIPKRRFKRISILGKTISIPSLLYMIGVVAVTAVLITSLSFYMVIQEGDITFGDMAVERLYFDSIPLTETATVIPMDITDITNGANTNFLHYLDNNNEKDWRITFNTDNMNLVPFPLPPEDPRCQDIFYGFDFWVEDDEGNEITFIDVPQGESEEFYFHYYCDEFMRDPYDTFDYSLIIELTPVPYYLDITIVGNGNVLLDPDKEFYAGDEVVTLTAEPDEDWIFVEWTGDLTGSTNPDTILMDGDKSVTCTFEETQSDILGYAGYMIGNTVNNGDDYLYMHKVQTTGENPLEIWDLTDTSLLVAKEHPSDASEWNTVLNDGVIIDYAHTLGIRHIIDIDTDLVINLVPDTEFDGTIGDIIIKTRYGLESGSRELTGHVFGYVDQNNYYYTSMVAETDLVELHQVIAGSDNLLHSESFAIADATYNMETFIDNTNLDVTVEINEASVLTYSLD